MDTDAPTLFDPDVVARAANEHGIDSDRLTETVRAHQQSVEDLPGVENIVYEWRKQYEDPLLARTETAYYLAVPRQLWDEFGAALDLDEGTLSALIDVHRRTVADAADCPSEPADGVAYIALSRTL